VRSLHAWKIDPIKGGYSYAEFDKSQVGVLSSGHHVKPLFMKQASMGNVDRPKLESPMSHPI